MNNTSSFQDKQPSQQLYVSDFDGTLTVNDSMFAMLRYHRGMLWLTLNLLRMLPKIVLMFLGRYSNHRAKETLLRRAFNGLQPSEFLALCQRFGESHRHILRQDLYHQLQKRQAEGAEVIVITASPELWVKALVPEFRVVGTQLDLDALTSDCQKPFFSTQNCYGPEKVHRLIDAVPALRTDRANYHITAYGDSRGDKELLDYADEGNLIR